MQLLLVNINDGEDYGLFLNGTMVIRTNGTDKLAEDIIAIMGNLKQALGVAEEEVSLAMDGDWNWDDIYSEVLNRRIMKRDVDFTTSLIKGEVTDPGALNFDDSISTRYAMDVEKSDGNNQLYASIYPLAHLHQNNVLPHGLSCVMSVVDGKPTISIGLNMDSNMIHVKALSDTELVVLKELEHQEVKQIEYSYPNGIKSMATCYKDEVDQDDLNHRRLSVANAELSNLTDKLKEQGESIFLNEWQVLDNEYFISSKEPLSDGQQMKLFIVFNKDSSVAKSVSVYAPEQEVSLKPFSELEGDDWSVWMDIARKAQRDRGENVESISPEETEAEAERLYVLHDGITAIEPE